jgi:hypothetical protein
MSELPDAAHRATEDDCAAVKQAPSALLPAQDTIGETQLRGLRPPDIRRANRELILKLLARDGPASRVALARRTGLSRAAVGTIVAELLHDGSLREGGVEPSSPAGGRRATLVCLNKDVGDPSGKSSETIPDDSQYSNAVM